MNKKVNITIDKAIPVLVMFLCILCLTASNFFIYPASVASSCITHSHSTADEECPAPLEEKPSSKTALTLQEDFIHDLNSQQDLSAYVVLSRHKIHPAERLQVIHFELDAPPPKA